MFVIVLVNLNNGIGFLQNKFRFLLMWSFFSCKIFKTSLILVDKA